MMQMKLSIVPHCQSGARIALAAAAMMSPLLVGPQTALAQGALHRGRGGGGRPGVPYHPPVQPRSDGPHPDVRPPTSPGTSAQSAARPYGGQNTGAVDSARAPRRSVLPTTVTPTTYNANVAAYSYTGSPVNGYFLDGSAYYGNYYATAVSGLTVPSLYSNYNTYPPFIGNRYVTLQPPQNTLVPFPLVASDGLYQGDQIQRQAGIADATTQDPALARTVSDIEIAWNQRDLTLLAPHIGQQVPVSVYLNGKFLYSLDGDAYLTMTRDALTTINTVLFKLDSAEQRADDLYIVGGRHTYIDKTGNTQTVRVKIALGKAGDQYYICRVDSTQEGASPAIVNGGQARQPGHVASGTQSLLPQAGGHAYVYNPSTPVWPLTGSDLDDYFPSHSAYYRNYHPHVIGGTTLYSPYYYYEGLVPPFIDQVSFQPQKPPTAYVPFPEYDARGVYKGDRDTQDGDQNAKMSVADATAPDRLLARAITDIEQAWTQKDLGALARHVHRDNPLAIYLRGGFFYSLDGSDYLNITRDALAAIPTDHFELETVQEKAHGIYCVSGHHLYTDKQGTSQTILVSYVLEKVDDDYYLTQISCAQTKRTK
jgi:hypothetical protein